VTALKECDDDLFIEFLKRCLHLDLSAPLTPAQALRYFWWGAWVAQSVKHLTLDLSSGLDLWVMSSNPVLGSTLGVEPTLKKKRRYPWIFGLISMCPDLSPLKRCWANR